MVTFLVTLQVEVDVEPEDLWDNTIQDYVDIYNGLMVSVEVV